MVGWIVFIILLITIILLGFMIWAFRRQPTPTPTPKPTDPCAVSNLIDISNLSCCEKNGVITSYRYVSELDLVVAPFPSYYVDVCQGFCVNGFNGQDCVDGLGSTQFQQCLTELAPPSGCQQPARAVATNGSQLFYGFSATNAQCPIAITCS